MAACSTCKSCFNSNPKKLDEVFEIAMKKRQDLVVFILNIFLNMEKCYMFYCTCKNQKLRLVCEVTVSFKDIQYGIYQHSLNFKRIALVTSLQSRLREIIKENNHFVCNIINQKIFYVHEN